MPDREQQLTEAATQYLALLEGERLIGIQEFVATVDPDLRDELAVYIEEILAEGISVEPIMLSAEEQAVADAVGATSRDRIRHRLAAVATPAVPLPDLRKARKLSPGRLAQQINLPVDLLARIERGAVIVATLPDRLISELARALEQTDAGIRVALATPLRQTGNVRLSAEDNTTIAADQPVSFADALAQSTATPEQRAAWRE